MTRERMRLVRQWSDYTAAALAAAAVVLLILAMLVGSAGASSGCAHTTPAEETLLHDGVGAAVECVAGPALTCPWGSGWPAYRDCLRREVLPCVGERLASALPALVDLWGGLSVRYAGLHADARVTAGLAGVDACILALPEPTASRCGDVSFDKCGAGAVAWCLR